MIDSSDAFEKVTMEECMTKRVVTLLLLLAATACAKDADWNRFGYDTLQVWGHSVNPPNPSDASEPGMSYPQYQRERELQQNSTATK